MAMSVPQQSELLEVYLEWAHAWHDIAMNASQKDPAQALSIDAISQLFERSNVNTLLENSLLLQVVSSFHQRFANGEIAVGATMPPSCPETNCFLHNTIHELIDADLNKAQACGCIKEMLLAQDNVTQRCQEWNGHGIFTAERLQLAIEELTFCNMDLQKPPIICSGASITSLPPIEAPDRRPSPTCDTPPEQHDSWFPTREKIKLCVDAKYYFAMACGGSLVDDGLLRAIADAGNDILISDYCEAASVDTIQLLQKTGSAAVAFLKACNLAGRISDWQLDLLVASHMHFRVLGYYRNHALPKLPPGLYGSRMTDLTAHRYIDIAVAVGILSASLATGEQIDEAEYKNLSRGCTLINDLIDLRSDTMRKQRENTILRGIRGSACQYLNGHLLDCLTSVKDLIESKRMQALVIMAFCNWAVMGSHHKLYELVHGVTEREGVHTCKYDGLDEAYDRLLSALEPFGSLGPDRPQWKMKRMELDRLYNVYRFSPEKHTAWLADMVRLLLNPATIRRIVDVVHFPWNGDIGQVEYCP